MHYLVTRLEECKRFAELMASHIQPPMVLALMGTLGSGKTQWTRFLAEALQIRPGVIASPTFTLMHIYSGASTVVHVDAFRIKTSDEFLDLGLDEWFEQPAIVVVEWPERFSEFLPQDRIELTFEEHQGSRTICAEGLGSRSSEVLATVQHHWALTVGGEKKP